MQSNLTKPEALKLLMADTINLEQYFSLLGLSADQLKEMGKLVYHRPKPNLLTIPYEDRRKAILEEYSDLQELYNWDPTVHVFVDGITCSYNEWDLIGIGKQVLLQLIDTKKLLLEAFEQGFKPKENK